LTNARTGGVLVIVRGPLGIGKTTISKALVEEIGGRYVSVDEILEEYDLEQWDEVYISEASFLRSNAIVARRARRWLAKGTPVVVDGNFYYASQVLDLVGRLPGPSTVFTLTAPLELCVARDAGRERPLGEEGARLVFAKVTSFECGDPIDARRPLPKIVAEMRVRILAGRGAKARPTTSSAARARRSRG
jgi:tRNA uridine 5-carbamoylmethylation protein Kti12